MTSQERILRIQILGECAQNARSFEALSKYFRDKNLKMTIGQLIENGHLAYERGTFVATKAGDDWCRLEHQRLPMLGMLQEDGFFPIDGNQKRDADAEYKPDRTEMAILKYLAETAGDAEGATVEMIAQEIPSPRKRMQSISVNAARSAANRLKTRGYVAHRPNFGFYITKSGKALIKTE